MIQFQENIWTEGWQVGQTLYYRTLPATARGPIYSGQNNGFPDSYKKWLTSSFKIFSQ